MASATRTHTLHVMVARFAVPDAELVAAIAPASNPANERITAPANNVTPTLSSRPDQAGHDTAYAIFSLSSNDFGCLV
jgi:hypothetical protein